jgi:hypothetical protein
VLDTPASSPSRQREQVAARSVGRERSRLPRLLFLASVAAALLPVVVAVVRAVARGWLPIGDNAYFAIRARDVLTEHHPLLGTWTSASISAGTNFNNPGPLLFDLLAGPAKLHDEVGVAVGAALLNCLALLGIAWFAHRRGGPLLGTAAMAVSAALAWSMGSELLFDPWQPHSLLLTFFLLLVLTWSIACADRLAIPFAVAVASVVLQTHLSYGILIAALAVWAVVGLATALHRMRRDAPERWPERRRSFLRAGAATVVVLALAWAQPLVEQVTARDDGNLTRLLANVGDTADDTLGSGRGVGVVAEVAATPPWWLRPSFGEALQPSSAAPLVPGTTVRYPDLPSAPVAAALVALLLGAMAGGALLARRRRDRIPSRALGTAAAALVASVVTAVNMPISGLGVAPHQFRWAWPVAAFVTLALIVSVLRLLAPGRNTTFGTVVAFVLTVLVATLNLPTHNSGAGPAGDDRAIPVVRELNRQMVSLEGQGPVALDLRGIRYAEPYSGPVMAELQRRGVPFGVRNDEAMVRQLGSGRRLEEPTPRLLIREGDVAVAGVDGTRRVALVLGLTGQERRELDQLREGLRTHLESLSQFPLNERGAEVLALPEQADNARRVGSGDIGQLFATGAVTYLVEQGMLDLDEPWSERAERFAVLQDRWNHETVGLFLAPPEVSSRDDTDVAGEGDAQGVAGTS